MLEGDTCGQQGGECQLGESSRRGVCDDGEGDSDCDGLVLLVVPERDLDGVPLDITLGRVGEMCTDRVLHTFFSNAVSISMSL